MQDLNFTSKYRPTNLDEYIGLSDEKPKILNMMKQKVKPNFILITGSSGLGKTTLARIIAKTISCPEFKKLGKPCEECSTCKAFNEYIQTGNSDNIQYVMDINASKDTGKDATDMVIEDSQYPSHFGEHKFYLFDEAHRLSSASQNAILKPLEDKLPNVTFIMNTTNPEMLLSTIHSRVQMKIDIGKPKIYELEDLLKRICTTEEMPYSLSGISLIAERELEDGNLGIRSAINSLSQILVSNGNATLESAESFYSDIPIKTYLKYCETLLNGHIEENITILYSIKEKNELKEFLNNLLKFVMKGIYLYNDIEIKSVTSKELPNYKNLFKRFSIQELSVLLNSLRNAQQSNDIEADMLLLAFNGLKTNTPNSSIEPDIIKEDTQKELSRESVVKTKVKEKQKDERVTQTIEMAEKIVGDTVSLDELLND